LEDFGPVIALLHSNIFDCHPTSTPIKKPCDGQAPPMVNLKIRELEVAMDAWFPGSARFCSSEMSTWVYNNTIREAFI